MKKRAGSLSFGPGASSLILIFVVLSLTVLGMLALLSARNDMNLSDRSARVVEAQYALNQQAEERRASLDEILTNCRQISATQEDYLVNVEAALPEYAALEDNVLSFTVSDDSRVLRCELLIHDLSDPVRATWRLHTLTAETGEDTWN